MIMAPYEAEISSFSSASEFISHLQVPDSKGFDLIISDIQIPEICGLKLLTMIREQGCKIPVIAASSE
ncbi:MAG: response regulator, partial [Deltaproteobacteria bacterium]|nr:response regulator [Deltaproteobacteria bacterium]